MIASFAPRTKPPHVPSAPRRHGYAEGRWSFLGGSSTALISRFPQGSLAGGVRNQLQPLVEPQPSQM